MKKVAIFFIVLIGIGLRMNAQGCLEPMGGSSDGAKIIGYIQPQFDYHFYGKSASGNSLNQSTFKFNRARIGVAGSIPYDVEYYVLLEASPNAYGHPYLLDAFVSYTRLGPYAKFSLGSFKSPISLELNTPCHALHTINRSLIVDELTPNRDLGFMVLGSTDTMNIFGLKTVNLFKYSLAVTNGTGVIGLDNNNGKTYSGRIVFTPWKHLSLGASFLTGKYKAADPSATQDDEKTRYGFDAEFRLGNLLVQGEYLHGDDKGSYTVGGGCGSTPEIRSGSVLRDGYFVQAIYSTPWNLQPVIKYETYDPNKDAASNTDRQNIITFGLNYFLNDWTRIQLNYLYKAEETAAVEKPNDCILVQVQVKLK
ncbi:MAG: hypothetical protein PWR20_1961 [Bacteroidales bacterium]|jgi:phosphate-selective porin|nr:hypothetical protein [Bacteroidales bacterium]MDN5330480.1 hypothetical protein [Bacteroidales bacterium]